MLHKALRLVRIFHDKSQSQLAKELKISTSFLSEIESGGKKITIDLLNQYSRVFSIPPSSLLLFSERLDSNNFSENMRVAVARKVIKMLEWLAAKEETEDEKKPSKKSKK